MRVLIVEDEVAIATQIARTLDEAGYLAELSHDGEDAWFRAETETFDAIVLDLGLPRLDGLSVVRNLRTAEVTTPILILTARGAWMERVEGIDAGADDYLAKPFEMEELRARLHAVLRRSAGQASNVQAFGDLTIDQRRKTVTVAGSPIDLTPLEFRLLACFAMRPGEALSAPDLLDQIYGHDHDKDLNALEVLIGRLRRKIGAQAIGTRRGMGYFLKVDE